MQKESTSRSLDTLKEGDHIAFEWKYGTLGPEIIVAPITSVYETNVLVHFLYGYKSESEFVNKDQIIAIGDFQYGKYKIPGWSGLFIKLLPHEQLLPVKNSLTPEQLLNPRYEVIATYPDSGLNVGDILQRMFMNDNPKIINSCSTNLPYPLYKLISVGEKNPYVYTTNMESPMWGISLRKDHVEDFPHLFRKMNWWEGRTTNQMPAKIMSLADDKGSTYVIEEWDMDLLVGWINKKERTCCSLLSFKPEYGYIPVL